MRNIFLFFIGIFLLGVGAWYIRSNKTSPPSLITTSTPSEATKNKVTTIAQNLDTPWAIGFIDNNNMLVTERKGTVRLIKNGQLESELVATLSQVKEIGEGGLLGIAIDPDFSQNNQVFLYYTYSGLGNNTLNRVVRMIYENLKLKDETIIVDKIPGAPNHNGGRIKFGPEKLLYITTGDAEHPSQAQDINSLAGKILRVNSGGKVEIYSFGHRNPQGLAWDENEQLWATEHGRSGIQSGLDEINKIMQGKNYGWSTIQGDEKKDGMETPKLHSGLDTWAPAGAIFHKNSMFFGGLRGQALYEAVIDGDKISLKEHFKNQFGRIREVILGPDNMLYITTSNLDGRGTPKVGDDKIIVINPDEL